MIRQYYHEIFIGIMGNLRLGTMSLMTSEQPGHGRPWQNCSSVSAQNRYGPKTPWTDSRRAGYNKEANTVGVKHANFST